MISSICKSLDFDNNFLGGKKFRHLIWTFGEGSNFDTPIYFGNVKINNDTNFLSKKWHIDIPKINKKHQIKI